MPKIGGDLGAMEHLARRFSTAGEAFDADARQLTQRVDDALAAFTSEMATLDREARQLAEQIDGEMRTLRRQADSTDWTGRHRTDQDQVVAALETDIRSMRVAIDDVAGRASSIVEGELTATMTDMRTGVTSAGEVARSVTTSFAQGVDRQRASFDLVMNG